MEARYTTLGEVNERLARDDNYSPELTLLRRQRWYQKPLPWGWALFGAALILFGILFSIGLTLHEAYDAQIAMGAHVSPPPFNGFFETIHSWFSAVLANWLWHRPAGLDNWLWR